MFLDASAIISILADEPDAGSLLMRLRRANKVCVSAVAFRDSVLGLARARNMSISGSRSVTQRLLLELRAEAVSIDDRLGNHALDAFERFGKGRHRAALNLGDCFAYACARAPDVPRLCKGDDFPHTDLRLA